MNPPATPCRLYVYLANDAPLAVVLRRGPSSWTRLSLWHIDDDTFDHGQWMKNRVYERRCDLSPDGSLFTYFAFGSSHDTEPGKDSWVAISRPPWFSALALWFLGMTYYTGGFFVEQDRLWLGFESISPDRGFLPDNLSLTTDRPPHDDRTPNWTDRTVWLSRLLRGGWRPVPGAARETWERPHPFENQTLLMTWPIRWGPHGEPDGIEYAVSTGGDLEPLGAATWADWDHRGRLLIARDGRLSSWDSSTGLVEIADFTNQTPNPEPAPSWATQWP